MKMSVEAKRGSTFYERGPKLRASAMLLEDRRAENERGPKGLSEPWRSPEAEDSAGGTPAAGTDFGKKVF